MDAVEDGLGVTLGAARQPPRRFVGARCTPDGVWKLGLFCPCA